MLPSMAKRDSATVIKLRILLKGEDYLGLSDGPVPRVLIRENKQESHKDSDEKEERDKKDRKVEDVILLL